MFLAKFNCSRINCGHINSKLKTTVFGKTTETLVVALLVSNWHTQKHYCQLWCNIETDESIILHYTMRDLLQNVITNKCFVINISSFKVAVKMSWGA